jgi:hypothetical protein
MKNVFLLMAAIISIVLPASGSENEQKKVVIFAGLKPFNITKCYSKGYVDQWKDFGIPAEENILYFQSHYKYNPQQFNRDEFLQTVNNEISRIVQTLDTSYNRIPLKCCMKTDNQYKSKGEGLFSFIKKIGDEEVCVVVKLGSRLSHKNPQEDIKAFEQRMPREANLPGDIKAFEQRNPLLYSYVMVIPGIIVFFGGAILYAWCKGLYNKNH